MWREKTQPCGAPVFSVMKERTVSHAYSLWSAREKMINPAAQVPRWFGRVVGVRGV